MKIEQATDELVGICQQTIESELSELEHNEWEGQLRKTEERYHILASMLEGCQIIDHDWRYLYVNNTATKQGRKTKEELLGHTMLEVYPGIENTEMFARLRHCMEKRTSHRMENEFIFHNGTQGWFKLSVKPVPEGILILSIDITEHKQEEEMLRKSEQKFFKAFSSNPAVMSITRVTDGYYIDVNNSYTRVIGYRRAETLGHTSVELGFWPKPEDRDRFVKTLKEHRPVRDFEIEFRTKSEETRAGKLSADIIEIGGEPCLLSMLQDITEQKQAEELSRTLFHNSPIGIYIVQDGKFQYANPQFQKFIGYSKEELLGTDPLRYVFSGDRDVVRASAVLMLKERLPYPYEYRIINKAGQVRWVMETVTSIQYREKRATLGNYMDITERKLLEKKMIEYEELNKLKSDLLSTVSHELRTPLATIKGYSTMILDYYKKLSDEEKKEHLQSIDRATDRLARQVDRLLDMSRLDAGLLKLDKASTSISTLIKEAVVEGQLRAPQYKIMADVRRGLPKAMVDAGRIQEILDNLIDNACKYSKKGTEVVVSARRAGKQLIISVADQGIGIPTNEIERIYDRMYRIKQRLNPKAIEGIGLGLAICKGLVEAHGGHIWMESKEGRGSKCSFTLPLKPKGVRPCQISMKQRQFW